MKWKLATFNVNGIRARLPQVLDWVHLHQPDVMCLQEIKCQTHEFPVDAFFEAGYASFVRGQKAFHGVAILTRTQPADVRLGFDDGAPDEEARLIAVLADGVWVVNTYIPQGRAVDDPAFQYKLDFFARLKRWLVNRFDADRPLVWAGDLNVAPTDIDVFDPERTSGEVGCHPSERHALADVAAWGLVDLFRRHHPDQKQFTFWDYRLPNGFKRNLGWRLDHILATAGLADVSGKCQVDVAPRGLPKPSDHTPVWAEFDLARLV